MVRGIVAKSLSDDGFGTTTRNNRLSTKYFFIVIDSNRWSGSGGRPETYLFLLIRRRLPVMGELVCLRRGLEVTGDGISSKGTGVAVDAIVFSSEVTCHYHRGFS